MDASEPVRPAYKNRKGGLVFFGVVEIILGLCCLLLIGLMAVAILLQGKMGTEGMPSQSAASMVPALGIYGLMAIFFFVLGAGSIMGRRWARAVTLVVSIYWLIVGVLMTLFLAYSMPRMMGAMSAVQGDMSGRASALPTIMITLVTLLFIGFFFVIVPAAFVLFYRSPHVKATCEHLDPKPRWTDRVPLPVLFLSLLLAVGGASMLFLMASPGMPFFGHLFKGPLFIFMALLAAAVGLILAYFIFLRRRWAWTATLALTLLWAISGLITILTMKPADMMGAYSSQQVPGLDQAMNAMRPAMVTLMVVVMVIWLIYLLFMVRYFKPAPPSGHDAEAGPPAL